jgi:hypothetical protein
MGMVGIGVEAIARIHYRISSSIKQITCLYVKLEEDVLKITGMRWMWSFTLLTLKIWSPHFDPRIEWSTTQPIWDKLLGLPLEFWSLDVFSAIENSSGTFLEVDDSF